MTGTVLIRARSNESYSRVQMRDQDGATEKRIKFSVRPRKPRRNRLLQMNAKRRRLLRGIAAGLCVSEAGRAAGYGTAQSAHRAMNLIRIHMPEVLDKIGLPAEKVLKNLVRSVDAKKTLYFSYRGVVMDTREVPDHRIQLRALIELGKMLGLYPRSHGQKSDDRSEGYSPPMINLVMPGLKRPNATTQRLVGGSRDHDQPALDEPSDRNEKGPRS